MGGNLGRDTSQIGDIVSLKLQDIEASHVEQLVDEPLKTADLLGELGMAFEFGQDADMRLQHGDRRTQLMGGIGNEPLLRVEGGLQSVQAAVDGGHQSMNVARKPALGQPHGYGARANGSSLVGGHAQRRKTDACHEQIDKQEDDDEGDPDPGNVLDELLQYAVKDDVAGVEGDLDPNGLIREGVLHRQPIIGRLLVRLKNEKIAGRRRVDRGRAAAVTPRRRGQQVLRSSQTMAYRPLFALKRSVT